MLPRQDSLSRKNFAYLPFSKLLSAAPQELRREFSFLHFEYNQFLGSKYHQYFESRLDQCIDFICTLDTLKRQKEQELAAVQIQNIWKDFATRRLKIATIVAATKIQRSWKSCKFQSLHKKIFHAASMIQTSWKTFATRTAPKALNSAQIIQRIWCKFVSRRSRNLEYDAAIKLQRFFCHFPAVCHQIKPSTQDVVEQIDAQLSSFILGFCKIDDNFNYEISNDSFHCDSQGLLHELKFSNISKTILHQNELHSLLYNDNRVFKPWLCTLLNGNNFGLSQIFTDITGPNHVALKYNGLQTFFHHNLLLYDHATVPKRCVVFRITRRINILPRKNEFSLNRRHDSLLKYHEFLGPNNILIVHNADVPVTKAAVSAAILARHRFVHNIISNFSKYISGVDALVNTFTIKNLNANLRWSREDVVGVTENIVHPILHSRCLTTDGITPTNHVIDATNRSVVSSNADYLDTAITNALDTSDHLTLSADNVTVAVVRNSNSVCLTPNVTDAINNTRTYVIQKSLMNKHDLRYLDNSISHKIQELLLGNNVLSYFSFDQSYVSKRIFIDIIGLNNVSESKLGIPQHDAKLPADVTKILTAAEDLSAYVLVFLEAKDKDILKMARQNLHANAPLSAMETIVSLFFTSTTHQFENLKFLTIDIADACDTAVYLRLHHGVTLLNIVNFDTLLHNIKLDYHKFASKYHPDRLESTNNKQGHAAKTFTSIDVANETFNDVNLKRLPDNILLMYNDDGDSITLVDSTGIQYCNSLAENGYSTSNAYFEDYANIPARNMLLNLSYSLDDLTFANPDSNSRFLKITKAYVHDDPVPATCNKIASIFDTANAAFNDVLCTYLSLQENIWPKEGNYLVKRNYLTSIIFQIIHFLHQNIFDYSISKQSSLKFIAVLYSRIFELSLLLHVPWY